MTPERAKEILGKLNTFKDICDVMTSDEIEEIWGITKSTISSALCTIANQGKVMLYEFRFIEQWYREGKAKLVIDAHNYRRYECWDVVFHCCIGRDGNWVNYKASLIRQGDSNHG